MIIQHSDGVCPPGLATHHSLVMVEISGRLFFSLFLSFAKEGFTFGNLEEKL
jgi:hypothetical protein